METETPVTKKRIPWHPLVAALFVVVLYFAASFLAGTILGVALVALGWGADRINDTLSSGSVPLQFSYVVLVEAVTIGFLLLFLRIHQTSIKVLGFIKPRLADIGKGLLAYPLYFVVFLILAVVLPKFIPGLDVDQEQQLGFDNVVGAWPLVLTFISLVVLPPIVEEILFRGFLFSSFRARVGFWFSTIVTSIIFAIAHLPGGGSGGPLYIAAVDTFILSVVLCYLRERTGSLWAGITLHAVKNGVAFLSLFILTTT